MTSTNAIFLSIRSQYASKIFDGTKTVELRRVRPRYIEKGALVLIYVPSPVKSLVGAFKIDQVVEMDLSRLWKVTCDKAGITQEEFDAYYEGVSRGVAIYFKEVWNLPKPIELYKLKEEIDFHPPQGFRYVKERELIFCQLADFVADNKAILQNSLMME